MAAVLTVSNQFAFADGNAGHACALGSAPSVGDFDILYVNSDTTVSTPSGFAASTTAVNRQGAYIFTRQAVGGESSSVTITTTGDFNAAVTHERWSGLTSVDTHASTQADGAGGLSTPVHSTGTLSTTGELVVAMAALHGLNGGGQNTPVWSTGFTGTFSTPAAIGTDGRGAANWTASKSGAGTAAEAPQVSWSGNAAADRYMLTASFTVAAAATQNVTAALTITDTITATAAVARPADAALTITDTLAGTAAVARPVDAALVVTNVLTATAVVTRNIGAVLTVTNTLAATVATPTGIIRSTPQIGYRRDGRAEYRRDGTLSYRR